MGVFNVFRQLRCRKKRRIQMKIVFPVLSSLCAKFLSHVKDNWPGILINILCVLLGSAIAIGGILWTFQRETDRALKIQADNFKRETDRSFNMEVDIFKRYFGAVISECAENQAVINKLKKEISPTHFNLQLLSSEVSKSLIGNPMLYKFTGDEYLYALRTYLTTVNIGNRMLDFIFDDFKADGEILDINIEDLNKRLDECLYYLYILEYQTQLYVHSYDVRWPLKPGNYEEVMSWLKKKTTITIDELKSKVAEISKLDEKHRLELQEGIQKVLQGDSK